MTVDECSLIGNSGTPIVDTFHLPGSNNISITCNNISVQSTVNVFNIGANSCNFFLTGSDFSVTNVINCSGGSPRFNIGGATKWTVTGAKVTGAGSPVITQLNGRSSSLITESKSSGTITSGNTSTAVTFSTALDVTPTASDILVTLTGNPGTSVGAMWITSVSASGFTLNTEVAPTGNTNFSYKCNVS